MEKKPLEIPPLRWNGHGPDLLGDDGLSDGLTIVSALRYALLHQGIDISKKIIAGLTGAAWKGMSPWSPSREIPFPEGGTPPYWPD